MNKARIKDIFLIYFFYELLNESLKFTIKLNLLNQECKQCH